MEHSIDREKVINDLQDAVNDDWMWQHADYYAKAMENAIFLLKKHEAKTGRWIYKKYDDMFMCPCCEKYSIRNDYPYCHWCGAKMEGR